MQILSDYHRDARSRKFKPGAYEWWYFDGIDVQGEYSFVVIFYEGNPFSTRYIKRLTNWNRSDDVYPEEHPAVSISVYKEEEPIYYSFTEFDRQNCSFDETQPRLKIGGHTMRGEKGEETIEYHLNLRETLPSGDKIDGSITFVGPVTPDGLLEEVGNFSDEGHLWNLVQPRAEVTADFKISARTEKNREISFKGTGYHDHNIGHEPMRNEFREWYWGRFHFEMGTLVYYIIEYKDKTRHQAWLIDPENSTMISTLPTIQLQDEGWNRFGLKSARKILLSNEKAHITIQQSRVLDNGPFYQRFNSDSFMNIPDRDIMQVAQGISEFLMPDRIYWRIFWPFVNMRIRYDNEPPHWVQRSKRLYRWTW